MKQLIEFTLPDNSTILAEVEDVADESELGGFQSTARNQKGIMKSQETFSQALDNLKPMVDSIKQKFNEMNEPADEVEVKFGLKLTGQFGAVITVGGEASYEITLRWKK
ncbi:hypothetical protein IQ266_21100 [filamentous cyanobacterium LEGE 11480]|uniref:Trypsin-co-occurring domain-containing protein n=1 Tax=Romeriopsis navalis LEGE 11480 TaxID=2777977 RepID=A0A928VTG2_9CYAN|nr:CU044_2847 family protein [Romeriopsis navalis]MBE9032242.1 hypothetical protein [Romeriopsis navalis LEGE 11480]